MCPCFPGFPGELDGQAWGPSVWTQSLLESRVRSHKFRQLPTVGLLSCNRTQGTTTSWWAARLLIGSTWWLASALCVLHTSLPLPQLWEERSKSIHYYCSTLLLPISLKSMKISYLLISIHCITPSSFSPFLLFFLSPPPISRAS